VGGAAGVDDAAPEELGAPAAGGGRVKGKAARSAAGGAPASTQLSKQQQQQQKVGCSQVGAVEALRSVCLSSIIVRAYRFACDKNQSRNRYCDFGCLTAHVSQQIKTYYSHRAALHRIL